MDPLFGAGWLLGRHSLEGCLVTFSEFNDPVEVAKALSGFMLDGPLEAGVEVASEWKLVGMVVTGAVVMTGRDSGSWWGDGSW